MKPDVYIVTADDDLKTLVADINGAQWDEANGTESYTVDALRSYLQLEGTVFVSCYLIDDRSRLFAGMASARLELKPYDLEKWLYIDEVDSCSNLRKRGVGTAMMNKLFAFAQENGCDEVWLATEANNRRANSFYESLSPDSIDAVIGYTFEGGRRD